MKSALRAVIALSVSMLVIPVSVNAEESKNSLFPDNNVFSQDEKSEVTEIFDWHFGEDNEIMPYGTYFAYGRCGIAKKSSTSVYITGDTECYKQCSNVKVTVTLQKLKNGTWCYVTERSNTEYNSYSSLVNDTIGVSSGYYYRVVSTHSATKNGVTEVGSGATDSIYIN